MTTVVLWKPGRLEATEGHEGAGVADLCTAEALSHGRSVLGGLRVVRNSAICRKLLDMLDTEPLLGP